MYAQRCRNIIVSHSLHAGLLMDDINVFDYAPGLHIATITVNDTLGSSAGESFTFLTPEAIGRQSGIVVLQT